MASEEVVMTCMTTKQKFNVSDPEVIVLKNGRYAYRALCPWVGKNSKPLYAFKFCTKGAYENTLKKEKGEESDEEEVEIP